MITTFEIVFMVILAIGLGVAVWWFFIAEQYRRYLGDYSYSRGANAIDGTTTNLTCDSTKEICVYRATQICTNPDSNNFEDQSIDPIAAGEGSFPNMTPGTKYGQFNPATTTDLTSDMSSKCNGGSTASYDFTSTCSVGTGQLIATYTCIPKGSTCQAWKSS